MAETLNYPRESDIMPVWNMEAGSVTEQDSENSTIINIYEPFCRKILYMKVANSSVDIWDLIILIPNVLFLLFLIYKMPRAYIKLRKNDSPMFSVCLILVCSANVISVIRCIVSMCLTVPMGTSDRVMWLLLKFFLLATELSVIVFGFMFGHLDSKRSIQRVLCVTFFVALAYSFTQGALEFFSPNQSFHNITVKTGNTYYLFGHGGMVFWFVSSVILSLVYITVCILPFTALPERFALPTRRSFYVYCAILAFLNVTQSVGCGLLYFVDKSYGWCIIDITAYLYFAGFALLIYVTFLRSFFTFARRPKVSFSYQTHIDEQGGEDADLPYAPSSYIYSSHPPINAAEEETEDENGAGATATGEATRSQQSVLHSWLHGHGVFVGIPEVKNLSIRRPIFRSTPSPLPCNDDHH